MEDRTGQLTLRGIHHIGVVVDDLAVAEMFITHTLGLDKVAETERADLRASFFDCHGTQLEMIEIVDRQARASRLGDAQARIEHIAVIVDDLDGAVTTLAKLGVETQEPRISAGRRVTWTRPETSDGVMYQLMEGSEPEP